MKFLTRWFILFACIVALFCSNALVIQANAKEQSERFLEGLRSEGLYSLALDYLDQMEKSQRPSEAFRKNIPYERGVTLLAQANSVSDVALRGKLTDKAATVLEGFAKTNQDNPKARKARSLVAGAYVRLGMMLRMQAENLPKEKKAERDKKYSEARTSIDKGLAKYESLTKTCRKIFDATPKADPKRKEAGQEWLKNRSLTLRATYERILTFPPKSKQRKELAKKASKDFFHLYDLYNKRIVGLEAHFYEGRCHELAGDLNKAIGCYEDLGILESKIPTIRKLVTKSIAHQAECYIQKKKYNEAIERGERLIQESRKSELQSPNWVAARYQLALAYLKKMEATPKGKKKNDLKRLARDHFRFVVRQRSSHWTEAREHYAALSSGDNVQVEAKTFAQAYLLGKDAFDQMNANNAALDAAKLNAPDRVAELKQNALHSREEAERLFRLAISLADSKTNIDDLNQTRFYLCWLAYTDRDYWAAAVLGEFITQRYPKHFSAMKSAKIAMSSYQQLYANERKKNVPASQLNFEIEHMSKMADLITKRWPNTKDSTDAYLNLINFALREGRIDSAKDILNRIPKQQRPAAERKIGVFLWAKYKNALREAKAKKTPQKDLDAMLSDAVVILERGTNVADIKPEEIDNTFATAQLFLAQAYNTKSRYADALRILEKPKVGPLALVAAKHAAGLQKGFAFETYSTAIQSHAFSSPPNLEQAEQLMKSLDASVGKDSASKQRLMRIYLGLGIRLQKRMATLKNGGNEEDVLSMVPVFEKLLDHLRATGAGNSTTNRWLARAYFQMGDDLSSGEKASPQAVSYFKKSLAAYEALSKTANGEMSPLMKLSIQKQQADCLVRLLQFDKAVELYADVLKEKPMMLDVQRSAALAYEEWGGINAAKYKEAIGGAFPDGKGKNIILGWAKLANLAGKISRRNPKYKSLYFESWYHAVLCHYKGGMKSSGSIKDKKLKTAKKSIQAMYRLYPELGGPAWKSKFDAVMKKIQKALGEKALGLKAFDKK